MKASYIIKKYKCKIYVGKNGDGIMIYCSMLKCANWGDESFYDLSNFKFSEYWTLIGEL